MSDFHIIVFFNDYYTLIVAFLTKQIQNRYRYRHLPDSLDNVAILNLLLKLSFWYLLIYQLHGSPQTVSINSCSFLCFLYLVFYFLLLLLG